jgi:hypothetical protein
MKKLTRKQTLLRLPRDELRVLNFGEKLRLGRSLGGKYFVAKGTKVTKRTTVITASSWHDWHVGTPHTKAARLRKEGRLGYGAGGEERAIPKSVRTRRSRAIQRAQPQYERTPTTQIPYINTAGVVAYDYFWKDNLRIMHNFRDAVEHAKFKGDGSGLRPFRHKVIMTYDGPGLRGYRNKNTQIYPETSLRKILKVENAMTDVQKARYHADINYRHLEEAA